MLCFGAASAVAQNPRAVIKAVYKGDSLSTIAPKYFKAKTSNPDGDPSMKLMDAVYLNAADSSIKAYYIYCSNRAAIESNNEIAKMLGISRSYVSRIETKAINKLSEVIKE